MSYFRKCLKVPGNAPRQKPDIRKLSVPEHREIVFLFSAETGSIHLPDNPESWHDYRDDLLFVAIMPSDEMTNLNLSEHGLNQYCQIAPCAASRTDLSSGFSASIIKHPQDAETRRLQELIHSLVMGS